VIRKEKQAKEGEVYNRRKSDQRKEMAGKAVEVGGLARKRDGGEGEGGMRRREGRLLFMTWVGDEDETSGRD
jgi:hypothetical protein